MPLIASVGPSESTQMDRHPSTSAAVDRRVLRPDDDRGSRMGASRRWRLATERSGVLSGGVFSTPRNGQTGAAGSGDLVKSLSRLAE